MLDNDAEVRAYDAVIKVMPYIYMLSDHHTGRCGDYLARILVETPIYTARKPECQGSEYMHAHTQGLLVLLHKMGIRVDE